MGIEKKTEITFVTGDSKDIMTQLEEHLLKMHPPRSLAAGLSYILTFYTAHKAGMLVEAPPDYLEQIVKDVAGQLGVVTVVVDASDDGRPN